MSASSNALVVVSDPPPTLLGKLVHWLRVKLGRPAAPADRPRRAVPVYVMLQLDFALDDRSFTQPEFESQLTRLAAAGARGVMVDVWWGVCEPLPGVYDFSKYVALAALCRRLGLKLQCTMSWHACGGNVGDDVNIPLPKWATDTVEKGGMFKLRGGGPLELREMAWYTSPTGEVTREYLSLSVDEVAFLPAKGGEGKTRTPLDAYAEFMAVFKADMSEFIDDGTVVEIQVGAGPCGELRYPSYQGARGWNYPGIGEFQCFDKGMQYMWCIENPGGASSLYSSYMPVAGSGTMNDHHPTRTPFFRDDGVWRTAEGAHFLEWYERVLHEHGDRLLSAAHDVFTGTSVKLSVKIAGIHWWYATPSHAAELKCGYYNTDYRNGYATIAKLLRKHNAVFNFTCLEMHNWEQPPTAHARPHDLVQRVWETAAREGVRFAGENALERYDMLAYRKIAGVFREAEGIVESTAFTYLRNGPKLFTWWHYRNFKKFVALMSDL